MRKWNSISRAYGIIILSWIFIAQLKLFCCPHLISQFRWFEELGRSVLFKRKISRAVNPKNFHSVFLLYKVFITAQPQLLASDSCTWTSYLWKAKLTRISKNENESRQSKKTSKMLVYFIINFQLPRTLTLWLYCLLINNSALIFVTLFKSITIKYQ